MTEVSPKAETNKVVNINVHGGLADGVNKKNAVLSASEKCNT